MTLPSAIRAELYRTARNKAPLFWAFFAVPLLFLLLAILREVQLAGAPTEHSLAHVVIRSLRTAGNPMVHLFYAIGAATLFAGEYHWQTWRVLVPRNSRTNIVCAKFATYGFFLSLSLIACLVADLMPRLIVQALAANSTWELNPVEGARLGVAFIGSLFEGQVIGSIVALVAIATRSLLAAVLLPFLMSLCVTLGLAYLMPSHGLDLLLLAPSHAGDVIRSWAAADAERETSGGAAFFGLVSLVMWLILTVIATIMTFQRQDLARV